MEGNQSQYFMILYAPDKFHSQFISDCLIFGHFWTLFSSQVLNLNIRKPSTMVRWDPVWGGFSWLTFFQRPTTVYSKAASLLWLQGGKCSVLCPSVLGSMVSRKSDRSALLLTAIHSMCKMQLSHQPQPQRSEIRSMFKSDVTSLRKVPKSCQLQLAWGSNKIERSWVFPAMFQCQLPKGPKSSVHC